MSHKICLKFKFNSQNYQSKTHKENKRWKTMKTAKELRFFLLLLNRGFRKTQSNFNNLQTRCFTSKTKKRLVWGAKSFSGGNQQCEQARRIHAAAQGEAVLASDSFNWAAGGWLRLPLCPFLHGWLSETRCIWEPRYFCFTLLCLRGLDSLE